MNKMKRILATLLSLSLVFALTACSGDDNTDNTDNNTAITDYVQALADYTQTIASLDPDTVLFTVNGEDVTAEFYLYWLTYDCYYWDYMNYVTYGAYLDFEEEVSEGYTVAQYLRDDAKNFAAYYVLIDQLAAENNCGLTEEQSTSWAEEKAKYIEENGEDGFNQLLAQYGLTEEVFDRINTYSYVYANLKDALVEEPSELELSDYISANKIYSAKHILICTATKTDGKVVIDATGKEAVDENGDAWTATATEYNAAALAKAESILAQLQAAVGTEEFDKLFDELMKEYSEDTGLETYPDGYTFTTDEMVEEFEDGVKALKVGEMSGIVESEYGYHIILRLEPDVKADYMTDSLDAMLEELLADAEIVTNETFDAIDTYDAYVNYITYQSNLSASSSTKTEEK